MSRANKTTSTKVNDDGARYEISVEGDLVGLRLYDVTGDDALVYFNPAQVRRLARSLEYATSLQVTKVVSK